MTWNVFSKAVQPGGFGTASGRLLELRALGAALVSGVDAEAVKMPFYGRRLEAAGIRVADQAAEQFVSLLNERIHFDFSFAKSWASSGFPQITISPGLAASLMATSMSPEAVPDVALPWRSFVVTLPPSLITFHDGNGRRVEGHTLFVTRGDDERLTVVIEARNAGMEALPVVLLDFAASIAEFATATDPYDDDSLQSANRAIALARKLVVGVCIELDAPENKLKRDEGARSAANRRNSPEPKAWIFKLTRAVKVDVRPWVRSYLEGTTSRSPTVQTLVRGHHKRQPHGPGGVERKWIHVEPYWRGPEDAPIAARSNS